MALIEGETGRQRWSERFGLDRGDLPGSLRAVTGWVSRALGVEVYRAEGQRAALMQLGRFDECARPVQRALQIGPRDTLRSVVRGMDAFCHFGAGRYDEALAQARLAVLDSPTRPGPQLMLAASLWRHSKSEEARRIVRENAGRPQFSRQSLQRLLVGTDPRLVSARDRLNATLQDLGVP